jgi:hypothetical protein
MIGAGHGRRRTIAIVRSPLSPQRHDMQDEVRQAARWHAGGAGRHQPELGHTRRDRLAAAVVLGAVLVGLVALFMLVG